MAEFQDGLSANVEQLAKALTAQQQLMSREWHQFEVGDGAERRKAGREYQNDREYPIELAIVITSGKDRGHCMAHLVVQNVTTARIQVDAAKTDLCTLYTSVPPGGTYKLVMGTGWAPQNKISLWNEFR